MRAPLTLVLAAFGASAQSDPVELFEKKIRPVLAAHCYACHSSALPSPMAGLVLDTKAGLKRVSSSKLIDALRYSNPRLRMPPSGKLPSSVLGDFERWINAGAVDPRTDQPAAAKGIDWEKGRKWWAFQPVVESPAPAVQNRPWPRTKADHFILARLEHAGLAPSPPEAARTLLRRLYLDLTGLAPTLEEAEAFSGDYPAAVERLLASPHYGERWGRHWLDVVRYSEDNPTSEATNPPYPYAWRYRDWVIEAINRDMPYDRFVQLQLAADHMDSVPRGDLRALGYLGTGPIYHKDARLSQEVIETLATDDWDERVDAVSRGLLGLTVACARCHDHKFDPISTKDYYRLASVFASTTAAVRPLEPLDPATEQRYLWVQQRLFDLDYLAKLMTGEPGTKPEEAAAKVKVFRAEIARLKEEIAPWQEAHPELHKSLERYGTDARRIRGESNNAAAPVFHSVYDAGLWIDGSDPDLTRMDYRPGTPRDLTVLLRGSITSPGEPASRGFLTVLARGGVDFAQGSGRGELARRIFSDAAPLAARVMVNRVWGWHFGRPLVATPSDFGTQGEAPSHPELLDDLAARFIRSGWSLKWLHREILLSSTYRQSSRPRPDGEQKDPTNQLLWRMHPRRLDVEPYRDVILQASGNLDTTLYGPSQDLDALANVRRTIYGRVSRSRLHPLLKLYDFSDPAQHSPGRDQTTTPLQQLFVLNSAFMQQQAAALALRVAAEPDPAAKVRGLYRFALRRAPTAQELDRALSFLAASDLDSLAHALLSATEMIFWP